METALAPAALASLPTRPFPHTPDLRQKSHATAGLQRSPGATSKPGHSFTSLIASSHTHTHTHTHTHHRHGRRRNCTTARPTGPARHHPNLAHRGFNWRWPGQDIGHRPYIGRRDPDRVPRCRQLQCQAPAHEHMDAVVHQTPERQGMLPVLCVRKARRG